MTLSEYLQKNEKTQSEFADMVGVRQQTVSGWCDGAPPKRKLALKIVEVTKGAVTLSDLWHTKIA